MSSNSMLSNGRPVVYLTRRETFSASHRMHNSAETDEWNRETFGKCNHIHGHGHNYVVEVTLRGAVDPRTGMLINLVDLKAVMKDVLDEVDHRHLDKDVAYFRDEGHVSTTENLTVYLWMRVQQGLRQRLTPTSTDHSDSGLKDPGSLLHEIKVHETENNVVTYRGENSSSS